MSDISKVLFAVGGLYREGSGVARIVCELANALTRRGVSTDVYTAACKGGPPAVHMLDPGVNCVWTKGHWLGGLSYSPALRRLIRTAVAQVDVVHNHSMWMLPNSYAASAGSEHRKPVVLTAHGCFEPWALSRSAWKKRLVRMLFQDQDLRRTACIHVNTEREAESVRQFGLPQPITVIPNGVNIAEFETLPSRDEFDRDFPRLRGKRLCLFLSRVHEKKGLGHLIPAWRMAMRDGGEEWHLVIAGPDDGFAATVRTLMNEHGLNDHVTLTGPLYGQQKLAAFSAAEVFVLPSHSEGFSMAILEALASGLPAMITPTCNFPEVQATGAGIEVQPTAESTAEGLRALLSLSSGELAAMGQRGRNLVAASYSWDGVAEKLTDVYRWLAAGGPRPDTVLSDEPALKASPATGTS